MARAAAERADFVVIGAGIVGLSIAYQLARRGGGRVVVLEKGDGVGEGSTGASSACIRLRYTHTEVIRLAQDGMTIYRQWPEFTRLSSPRAAFQHTGVLWMLGEDRQAVEAERDRLVDLGARALVLDARGVRERYPALSTCGVTLDLSGESEHECADHDSYLFEVEGGYCTDPLGANQDLLEAARRDGVDVRFRSRVEAVRSQGGRVQGVEFAGGSRIDAPVVVNAAGPWCNAVNAMAGLELAWTLRPTRAQVMYRVLSGEIGGELPLVGDAAGGLYFRPDSRGPDGRGQQLLVGSIRPEDEQEAVKDPDEFDRSLDPDMRQRLLHALHHRLPSLQYRARVTGIAGLYTMNEQDVHPVVGPTELEGFVIANGFSGHGFKLAPAVGAMVAEWLTGKHAQFDTEVPMAFMSVDRQSLAVREKNVLA